MGKQFHVSQCLIVAFEISSFCLSLLYAHAPVIFMTFRKHPNKIKHKHIDFGLAIIFWFIAANL